jgi:RNA polymerase sigma factor (sigma-70 family)
MMGALDDAVELRSDFAAFYERHVGLVAAYLGRRVGRPDLVFDLVAETFARALAHRDQYDAQRGPPVAWLLGIARNLVADAARRGRVADQARRRLGMTPVVLDDDALERVELRASVDVRRLLAELPPTQREAVVRRVLADEPYALIAERIGCSEQVVRQRVSRGLAALRRESEVQ